MRKLSSLVVLALAAMGASVDERAAQAAIGTVGNGHVRFVAVGPAGMKIAGDGSTVSATEAASKVVVVVPLAPIHTGIGLRDTHMREKYLEVQKYPDAKLSVAKDALKLPREGGTTEGDAPGELALHGKTKPVKVHYKVKLAAGVYQVTGSLHIDMTDYGIAAPSYLGVSVKPGVDVDIEFQAKDR